MSTQQSPGSPPRAKSERKQEHAGAGAAHPKKLYTRIAVRDSAASICGNTGNLILDCFTPENDIGIRTAAAVIGQDVSEYMSAGAHTVSLPKK